jgi:predicted phage-related endonuclease
MIERYKVHSRDEWLALRSVDLTASDVGAAVGLDPYKSPLALYAEKTGLLLPQADNNAMRRGRWLEAAVLSAIREEHPDWEVRPAGIYLRDAELRLGATPDAIAQTDEPGLTNIQCKVVNRPGYERDWVNGPPLNYQLQTLTEGMLLDAHRSLVAALVIDTYTAELYLHPVPRHEAAEARVKEIATAFWSRVAAGTPPPADYQRDAETIAALHPRSEPETVVDLTGDNHIRELLHDRAILKDGISGSEKMVEAIDTEIKAKIGDAERATLPGWKLSWKTEDRAAYTVKASTRRVLRVTEIEEQAA